MLSQKLYNLSNNFKFMTNVYYSKDITPESIRGVFNKAMSEMSSPILCDDNLAVKVHFGEKGNTRFVSANNVKVITDELKKINDKSFLTDCNTLYVGMRLNATDHKKIAIEHGFDKLGLPIEIADGEFGDDESIIETKTPIFSSVKIGKKIAESDSMVVISHFKGHVLFGFGGAIKNLGMGCGSRAGKLSMHSKIKPSILKTCKKCGACISNCSVNAITFSGHDGIADIDQDICIGCAKCISACKFGSVKIPWGGNTSEEAQERCAEYALGATMNKKCVYITFINNIAKDCDCAKDSPIIGEDVGVVASIDPVAIDQASFDLVSKDNGEDIFLKNTRVDGTHIIDYSEEIGLGRKDYKLINF